MNQTPVVKLSIAKLSADDFERVADMAEICSRVVLQVTNGGHVYKAKALGAYQTDQETGKINLEFDRIALNVLAVDSADATACLDAIAKAPWAKLQVHVGPYGEAVFLLAKQ